MFGNGATRLRIRSLSALIAWVSLCLLAAGFGAKLAPGLQGLWAKLGLFGLLAAVGLEAAEKSQRRRKEQKQRAALQHRVELELGKFLQRCASFEVIRAAVRRVHDDAQRRATAYDDRRSESRAPLSMPVKVTPLPRDPAKAELSELQPFTAYTRDISPRGVGLLHDRPIRDGEVLLTFDLLTGETVSLIADLTWCRREEDHRYSAGGEIIEVATPVSLTAGNLPQASIQAEAQTVAAGQ